MSVSYNNSMYSLDVPYDDVDTSLCDECPYRFGVCWRKGYCIVDDVDW